MGRKIHLTDQEKVMCESLLNADEVFDGYSKILMDGFKPTTMFTSISQLQEWRPDLTDEKLAESGFIRGIHIVCISDGVISPMVPPE
jgi:hypothetical protein